LGAAMTFLMSVSLLSFGVTIGFLLAAAFNTQEED
jgi:hypothetical protein